LNLPLDHLDARAREQGELALSVPRILPLSRHDPQMGHAGRERLAPFDHHHAVIRGRQPAQVAGRRQTADATAQDQRRLAAHGVS
jgi:hypothetical protein